MTEVRPKTREELVHIRKEEFVRDAMNASKKRDELISHLMQNKRSTAFTSDKVDNIHHFKKKFEHIEKPFWKLKQGWSDPSTRPTKYTRNNVQNNVNYRYDPNEVSNICSLLTTCSKAIL
jgi:hypothetical protein